MQTIAKTEEKLKSENSMFSELFPASFFKRFKEKVPFASERSSRMDNLK
jgi:hypothetical protein